MKIISLLLIFSSGQILHVISQNNGNPYYGVPLGAIHYSDGNTRAEVYAANEYTIIFHHFTHQPRQLGCTSMIIGPSRAVDRNSVGGGVFLSISQPIVSSQPNARRRFIRQVPFSTFGMRNWPVEFDHLELRKDGKEQIISQQKDPFAGIEIDTNSSENVTTKTKDIHIEGISGPEIVESSTISTTNSNAIFSSIAAIQDDISSESVNEITLFDTNASNIFDGNEISMKIQDEVEQSNLTTDSIVTNTTTMINTEEFTSDNNKLTRNESEDIRTDPEFKRGDRAQSAMPANDILKRLLTIAEGNEHYIKNKEEGKVDDEIKDIIRNGDSNDRLANDGIFPHKQNSYSLMQDLKKKLLIHHEKKTEKSNKFNRKNEGFPVMLGEVKPEKWLKKLSQQSTAKKQIKDNDDKSATNNYLLMNGHFEIDENALFMSTQNAAITTTSLLKESTPLYWVIQDPRLKKRRRLEPQEKTKYENNLDHRAVTTISTTKHRLKANIDQRYKLPLIEDKTVVFSVTNGAKITEYQWIALRDHCFQRTIHLLSLKGIDPPHEEKIGALLGQSHNVTSHHIKIWNCNTIFIPGFVFNQGNDPPGTYFYAGIGSFPDRIEKQVRAHVVGQPPDQPLRNYKGENVMIRLPKTYRTFDIDFISVFNEIEGHSYGHVKTPNLLVPPCNDYDVI